MPEMMGDFARRGSDTPDYGVKRADYDKVASALIRTLNEFLADEFTVEREHGWVTVVGMIAETMSEASEK